MHNKEYALKLVQEKINGINNQVPLNNGTEQTNNMNVVNSNGATGQQVNIVGGTNIQPNMNGTSNTTDNVSSNSSPVKSSDKKKNPLLIVLILVAIVLLGIFVIYPFIRDVFINSPENVFKNSIDDIVHELNSSLDEYHVGNSLYDINFKIDTNIQGFNSFKDYTFGLRAGSDDSSSEMKLYMIDVDKKEYSFTAYLKNSKLYEKFSSFDKIIDKGMFDDSEFENIFDSLQNVSNDDISYLLSTSSNILKDSLDKSKFSRSNSKIKVNGNEIKVIKNTYSADGREISRLYKTVLKGLYDDSKSMEIINKYGISKDDMKSVIDEDISEDEGALQFNIYMNGGSFAGFDISDNNEIRLSFYTFDGNFNLVIGSDLESAISVNGVKNGAVTNVSISEYGREVVNLVVHKFDKNDVYFDYKIPNDGTSGSLDYKNNVSDKGSFGTLVLSTKNGNDTFNFTANINEERDVKIADFDETNVAHLSDAEEEDVINSFIISLKNTPLGVLLSSDNQLSYDYTRTLDNAYETLDSSGKVYSTEDLKNNTFDNSTVLVRN